MVPYFVGLQALSVKLTRPSVEFFRRKMKDEVELRIRIQRRWFGRGPLNRTGRWEGAWMRSRSLRVWEMVGRVHDAGGGVVCQATVGGSDEDDGSEEEMVVGGRGETLGSGGRPLRV